MRYIPRIYPRNQAEIDYFETCRGELFFKSYFPKKTIDIYGPSGFAFRSILPGLIISAKGYYKDDKYLEEVLKSLCCIFENMDIPEEYKKNLIRGILESGYFYRYGYEGILSDSYGNNVYTEILTEEYKKERQRLKNLVYDVFLLALERADSKKNLNVNYDGENKYNGISKWVIKGYECEKELREKYEKFKFAKRKYKDYDLCLSSMIDFDNMVINNLKKEIKYYENIILNKTNSDYMDVENNKLGDSYSIKKPKED